LLFEIHVTVKWGNTVLYSFSCYDDTWSALLDVFQAHSVQQGHTHTRTRKHAHTHTDLDTAVIVFQLQISGLCFSFMIKFSRITKDKTIFLILLFQKNLQLLAILNLRNNFPEIFKLLSYLGFTYIPETENKKKQNFATSVTYYILRITFCDTDFLY
jgi:hypothetical protein